MAFASKIGALAGLLKIELPPGNLGVPPGAIQVARFITHSRSTTAIAAEYGWHAGARYTNLRDVRGHSQIPFLDIDWKRYNFEQHLRAAAERRPYITIARDVEDQADLPAIIEQAFLLKEFCTNVVIVPKDPRLAADLEALIPTCFMLGFSVPTRYGGTNIPTAAFKRPVHLLGGRPDVQRRLASEMNVVSLDCNRFTLDAKFGDYFDGRCFRPHSVGGYERCIRDSLQNINHLWSDYIQSGSTADV